MKRGNSPLVLCLFGILPVVWLGLLIAPAAHGGLPEIVARFPAAMSDPFHIELCKDSLKTVLFFVVRLRACYRDIPFKPPQLPQGRRTRLGEMGQRQNRKQEIPGGKIRGQ